MYLKRTVLFLVILVPQFFFVLTCGSRKIQDEMRAIEKITHNDSGQDKENRKENILISDPSQRADKAISRENSNPNEPVFDTLYADNKTKETQVSNEHSNEGSQPDQRPKESILKESKPPEKPPADRKPPTKQPLTSRFTPVAAHLVGIAYFMDLVFANGLGIESRNWHIKGAPRQTDKALPYSLGSKGWNPQIDKEGNPLFLQANQVLYARLWNYTGSYHAPSSWPNKMMYKGHHLLNGMITLTWKGKADIRIARPDKQLSGSTKGMIKNGKRIYLTSGKTLNIEIHAIDRNDPPKQIRAWLPNPKNWKGSSLIGKTFHPVLIERLKDKKWSFIRFMDWMHTNNSPLKNWEDRRRPGDTFQSGVIHPRSPLDIHNTKGSWFNKPQQTGAAFELFVALCNATQKDIYINIPHLASDTFITKFAQLIQYGSDGNQPYTKPQTNPIYPPLSKNLKVYVEFSNEIWNPLFAQRTWADKEAKRLKTTLAQFNARQFSRSWRLFEKVMGADRVIRSAAIWPSLMFYSEGFLKELHNNPKQLRPEVLATTTYFGNGIQNWINQQSFLPKGSKPWTSSYWQSQKFKQDMEKAFDKWTELYFSGKIYGGSTGPDGINSKGIATTSVELAKKYKLPMICYEGGPSLYTNSLDLEKPEDDSVTLFTIAMNRHKRIVDIYNLHLNYAKSQGLWTHVAFQISNSWSKYGQWGHLEWLSQEPTKSVKYQFILQHFKEFSQIRHPSKPKGVVPKFLTKARLPTALQGQYYKQVIRFSAGDGTTKVKKISALLAQGLRFDLSTMTISGVPKETKKSYILIRLVDSDGDPAWREFSFKTNSAAIGRPLIEWSFGSPANGKKQNPSTTFNALKVHPSKLTCGNALRCNGSNFWHNEDAYAATSNGISSFNQHSYIEWTIQPKSGATLTLLQLKLGLFYAPPKKTAMFQLRVSTNRFRHSQPIPLKPRNSVKGNNLKASSGTPTTVNLSNIKELQNLKGAAMFRLYIWNIEKYQPAGIGKLGKTKIDLTITGRAR